LKTERNMRLTLDEYAKRYNLSKEMLRAKIKANKLNYIVEKGETFIILPDPRNEAKTDKRSAMPTQTNKPRITVATLIELYKRENRFLKEKIKQLEAKIDKLIDDKERMLKEERERIEQVYAAKDEQLKNILELISIQLRQEHPTALETKNESELHTIASTPPMRVELKEYLKSLDLDPATRKAIKKRFLSVKGSDIRVQEQNGKIFLDFGKYDYSDLLAL